MSAPSRRLLAVAIAVALPLVVGGIESAAAGTYTVRQCDYAADIGQHDFRWQGAGNPAIVLYSGSSCGEFGLATRNSSPGISQTYPSGGYGGWFAYAPPGTVFTRFAGSFGVLAGCCINGLATYAEVAQNGGGPRAYLFQGNLGNNSWYAPSGLQGPVGRSWDASTSGFTAKVAAFYIRCGPGFSCPQQKAGDLRLRGRSFDFTLRDDVQPSVGAPGGSLMAAGWVRGVRSLSFTAWDGGGGLTSVNGTFDNGTALASPSGCSVAAGRYVRLQPCPLTRSGVWSLDTAKLPDGVRTVMVRATDAGDAAAQQIRTIRVDNAPPSAPLAPQVVGGSGWRRSNGFVVRWVNPGNQHAPIAKARFRACRPGGGVCVSGESAAATHAGPLVLPHAGEWDVQVWLEDAAGNATPTSASAPLRLRLDPDPPLLRFLPSDPAAPSRIAAQATDLSGLVGGEIELRRRGSTSWRTLPTSRQGSRLVAEIDDSRARGVHDVRVQASDAAGNQALALGPPRTLPVRSATHLSAAVVKRVPRARVGCRPATSRLCRVRVTIRRSVARATHGSTVVIRARLTTSAGEPLAGRPLTVKLVSRDRVLWLPSARTDAAGRIALVLRARRSAVVRLGFDGDPRRLPSSRGLALHVPAPVTIASADQVARDDDEPIHFHGRVGGGAIPRRGKLVEVQAYFRGRWRTISAVRSTRLGRWRFSYAFQPSSRLATYRLRARVPVEAGYPFAAGASKPVRVTVPPR